MFQRYATIMALFSLLLAAAWFCVRGSAVTEYVAGRGFLQEPLACMEELLDYEKNSEYGQADETESRCPVIGVNVLEKKPEYELSESDYDALIKIVEAEAGSEDETGKLLVANVVLNRVKSDQFPDTVTEVVYQRQGGKVQFSPVGNGSIDSIVASAETIAAVERALAGEDVSQGALYFAARKAADPENMRWFDRSLTRLFAYGGHEFFN